MITDIIAGVVSGILGAMGFGGGGILILYLTLYRNIPQITAQGINLIFFIPSAALALYFHNRNKLINWKFALRLIITSLPGIIIGYFAVTHINDIYIRKIFALILIIMGIRELLSERNT